MSKYISNCVFKSFNINKDIPFTPYGTTGVQSNYFSSIFTSTGSSSITNLMINSYSRPILSSNNNKTIENSSTIYIDGPPISGNNQNITNSYSLYVASGTSEFPNIILENTNTNNRLTLLPPSTGTSTIIFPQNTSDVYSMLTNDGSSNTYYSFPVGNIMNSNINNLSTSYNMGGYGSSILSNINKGMTGDSFNLVNINSNFKSIGSTMVFDGRYIYFSTYNITPELLIRYDTLSPLNSSLSYNSIVITTINSNLTNIIAKCFDGRYLYFVTYNTTYSALTSNLFVRYDTTKPFNNSGSYIVTQVPNYSNRYGITSLLFVDKFVYMISEQAYTVRYDTTLPFTSSSSYQGFTFAVYNATNVYYSACFDGIYIYYTGWQTTSQFTRYDTRLSFSTAGITSLSQTFGGLFSNCVFDGRYVYYLKYQLGIIYRYDTTLPFLTANFETGINLSSLGKTSGYNGGFYDGRYLWLLPADQILVIYDTTKPFNNISSYTSYNLDSSSYSSITYDGKYVYCIQNNSTNSTFFRIPAYQGHPINSLTQYEKLFIDKLIFNRIIQNNNRVYLGTGAGFSNQASLTVAIGVDSGSYNQSTGSVSIGYQSGYTGHSTNNVSIGYQSAFIGSVGSITNVDIGYQAGYNKTATSSLNTNIGYRSGYNILNSARNLAIGNSAGYNTNGPYSVNIGKNAGYSNNNSNVIIGNSLIDSFSKGFVNHIGTQCGNNSSGNTFTLGYQCGFSNQLAYSTPIGYQAGYSNMKTYTVAIGSQAGYSSQAIGSIAIGYQAGYSGQQQYGIAIGYQSSFSGSSSNTVNIGNLSGKNSQLINSIAIGNNAGENFQQSGAIAIGNFSGQNNQNINSIAIGNNSANRNQNINSIAIGSYAGYINQNKNSIAIGYEAAYQNQGENSIAIGYESSYTGQASGSISIGYQAGYSNQNNNSVSIGYQAGYSNQNNNSVSIGYQSAYANQSSGCIAIGYQSGFTGQGTGAIAIGYQSGYFNQGQYSIAIGYQAGYNNQSSNSIILNSILSPLNASTGGLYINPIRETSNILPLLTYDTTLKSINYTNNYTGSTGNFNKDFIYLNNNNINSNIFGNTGIVTNFIGNINNTSNTNIDNLHFNVFKKSNINSNNTVTIDTSSTLYIQSPPMTGTNVSITNPYSLYVATGSIFIGGNNTNLKNNLSLNGIKYKVLNLSSDTTLSSNNLIINCDTNLSNVTLTLPSQSNNNGRIYYILKINSNNNIYINVITNDSINGTQNGSITLSNINSRIYLICFGSIGWFSIYSV